MLYYFSQRKNLTTTSGVTSLNQIYQEIKYDIWHFVSLYRLVKSSGMGVEHVVKLLTVANNHLPAVEYNYEELQWVYH